MMLAGNSVRRLEDLEVPSVSAWQFRKTKSLLGGLVRLSVTKKGIGVSAGVPGFRLSFGADGKKRRTISLPGTGLRKTEEVRERRR